MKKRDMLWEGAPSVQREHEGFDVSRVPGRSENSLVEHLSEPQVGCMPTGLPAVVQPVSNKELCRDTFA